VVDPPGVDRPDHWHVVCLVHLRVASVAHGVRSVDDALPAPVRLEAVHLKGPVPLDEVPCKHLKVAVHDGPEPAYHDAAHGVARIGVGVPQGVGHPNGVKVKHLGHQLGEVRVSPGAVVKVVHAPQGGDGGGALLVHLVYDLVALSDGGGKVVDVLDHLEGQGVLGVGDVAQVADDFRVGADPQALDHAPPLPRAGYPHRHLVLVHAVLHLVALQLVGVFHKVQHVVVGDAALLDVLAGGVQTRVGGRREAGGLVHIIIPCIGIGLYTKGVDSKGLCVF